MTSSRAERLAIAGAVAPILRGVDDSVKKRRVKVYSRETGETLREATMGDALRGLAEAYAIEHTVDDAAKVDGPKRSMCLQCGLEFECPKLGMTPAACGKCKAIPCAGGCGKKPPASAMQAPHIRRRKSKPWVCKECCAVSRRPANWQPPRPKREPVRVSCTMCGLDFETGHDGGVRSMCDVCQSKPRPCIAGCGKIAPKGAYSPSRIKLRSGKGWKCRPCAMREALSNPETKERLRARPRRQQDPEKARAAQKKAWADPALRERQRAKAKALASDPAWRAKWVSAMAKADSWGDE